MVKNKVKRSNNKRKINIFLIFLLCSFLAWFVSKLSETYVDRTTFDLEYINVPDSLLLTDNSLNSLGVRLRASGFQFLAFHYNTKKIKIDLAGMANKQTEFYITPTDLKKQIERQLSGTVNLLEVDRDTLYIDFYKVELKEVPITPNIKIVPAQNYLVDGQLQIEPPIISITGPKKELDFISSIYTSEVGLNEITEDFSVMADLVKPDELANSQLSVKKVRISGKVFRFSEKILEIPVEVINLPEGTQIKTFPSTISVICKARIERLRDISPSDFKVVANFQEHKGNDQNLLVQLIEKPGDVYSVQLLKNDVEFILKRQ